MNLALHVFDCNKRFELIERGTKKKSERKKKALSPPNIFYFFCLFIILSFHLLVPFSLFFPLPVHFFFLLSFLKKKSIFLVEEKHA